MRYLCFILFFIFISPFSHAFSNVYMGDYCATPPFLTRAIYPNVLILLDNSGSMNEFAYKEESDCRSWYGDTSLVYTGYNSSNNYYGYFDSGAYYDYDSSNEYFIKSATGSWSGNFLNWLTMRRIEVAKKVLTGGKYITLDSGYILVGQIPDRNIRKVYNDSIPPYNTPYHRELYFYFYEQEGYLYFIIRPYNGRDSTNCLNIEESTSFGEYRVAVYTEEKPMGIVQRTWDKMRFGLELFNIGTRYEDNVQYDGGYISTPISGPSTNISLISAINSVDPGTWTPLAESLYEAVRYFRGDASAYNSGRYTSPQQYTCQKNFVIIITDGESTKDQNVPGTCFNGSSRVNDNNFDVKLYMDRIASVEGYSSKRCSSANSMGGTYYLEGVAYYSHINDMVPSFDGIQPLNIYTVFCFDESDVARDILKITAKYGAFVDKNGNNIPDMQSEWDEDMDGVPDAYFEAQNGYMMESSLKKVLTDILKKTSSGTSASLLTKKTEVGKNLVQALFYPGKHYEKNDLIWVGYLYNYWFYSDINVSNIREDTIENKALDICSEGGVGGDNILNFEINNSTGDLNIKAYESTCSGEPSSISTTYFSLDEVHPVWEAGKILEQRDPFNRTIYTYVGDTNPSISKGLVELKDLNSTYSYLFGDENKDGIIDNEQSGQGTLIYTPISFSDLKKYIYGMDISGFRNRTTNSTYTWKLGDIIYSTPKIVNYSNYSVVFVGANDGMLHAFKLGKLRYDRLGAYQDVKLCNDKFGSCKTDELGKELWAFIPKNSLPYLRALADTKYCHLYYIDLMPYVIELDTDNDINHIVDRRILIGGMRLGGGVGCSDPTGCVNPPSDTCSDPSNYSASTNNCIGLSSYFALDVTNSTNPKLLWEFTDPDLGFTYSGPAFIKKDGEYFIMFASGPTNYDGESYQDLKFFVLKLNSDPSSEGFFTISSIYKIDKDVAPALSRFHHSFGGRLFTEGIDYDEDGNTDMVFIGATKGTKGESDILQGNIFGLKINSADPSEWKVIKVFNSPLRPITAKIEYAKCFDMIYLFFGTGRYFYPGDDPGTEGGTQELERLYGVRIDKCLLNENICHINNAHSASESCIHVGHDISSWYVELAPADLHYFKERLISDPTVTNLDVVFFSTTQPTTDICSFGGKSRMWQLNCATGEGLPDQSCSGYEVNTGNVKGKLYLQLSMGNIEDITPGTGSTSSFIGATTPWMPGITPESSTPFVGPSSSPKGKILLWIEK